MRSFFFCTRWTVCTSNEIYFAGLGFLLALFGSGLAVATPFTELDQEDRSPVDLVLSTDESWLATINQTSNSVSLVSLENGSVLDEIKVGERPVGVALAPSGNRLWVTSSHSGTLKSIRVDHERLILESTLELGFQPHGIAMAQDGEIAYVALTDADAVAVVDLNKLVVNTRIDVGRWPRYLALSQNGERLAVSTNGDRGVSIVDTTSMQLLHIDRFVGLNIGHMKVANDGETVYFPWMVYRRNPITEKNIRLGWVMASRLGRIQAQESAKREAISLDPPGRAIADPHGIDLSADNQTIVISSSGTHELIVMQSEGLPFQERGSTDHIDADLLKDENRFYRIELGGRPMGLRLAKDDQTVYVSNYLDNSVQIVDLKTRQLVQRIDLGGKETPSLARQGEAIFYDAKRSLDQWYSCYSCHYEGGSNAVTMDTFNDGTALTFKTVLPLYALDQSGPWTWHGWQKDMSDAMKHSLKTTMLGPEATEEDAKALAAYFKALQYPPNPFSNPPEDMRESVQRGESIFHGKKGGCSTCHIPPLFTDGQIHDLGLGRREDAHLGYNTPSLLRVFRKVNLLHDGRANSLQEVLIGDHAPDKVAGEELTDEELKDLIAYLKTL